MPLELVDGGSPTRTGSPTLTMSICRCRRDGTMRACGPEALGSPAGLSTGALLAILACVGTLLGERGRGKRHTTGGRGAGLQSQQRGDHDLLRDVQCGPGEEALPHPSPVKSAATAVTAHRFAACGPGAAGACGLCRLQPCPQHAVRGSRLPSPPLSRPALVLLFVALRKQKQAALLPFEEEDVRENIITYDDEGGGEEDTEAFDMAALQNPDAAPPPPQQRRLFRRDVRPRPHFPPSLPACAPPQPHDVATFLAVRLSEVDADPSVPPYDSIQVYGYEGQGSSAGSLSPPSSSCAGDSDAGGYEYLEEWGPLFRTLAELYGAPEGPPPT